MKDNDFKELGCCISTNLGSGKFVMFEIRKKKDQYSLGKIEEGCYVEIKPILSEHQNLIEF